MTKCFNKIRCINWTIISDVTVICRRVPLEFEDDHVGSYTVPMSASVANKVRRTAFRKAIFYFNYTSNPLLSNLLSSPILSYPILSYPILSIIHSDFWPFLFFLFITSTNASCGRLSSHTMNAYFNFWVSGYLNGTKIQSPKQQQRFSCMLRIKYPRTNRHNRLFAKNVTRSRFHWLIN